MALFCRVEIRSDDGDLRATVELGRLQAAAAGDNLFVLVDHPFDASGDGLNLGPIMFTRIAGRDSNLRSREM